MGTKGVRYIPLNQVKVIGGKCQALVGKAQNGHAILQVYTQQGTEEFAFRTKAKKNAGHLGEQDQPLGNRQGF